MKFEILTSKTSNQFHFISNLAEWHFSCRRRDNKVWLEKTGELTKEENSALKKFTKIIRKYSFGEKYLAIPFIRTEENLIWERVKKWVSSQEYSNIQEIFKVFDKRFNIVWEEEKSGLKLWEGLISDKFIKDSLFKKMFMEVKYFLRAKQLPDLLEIYPLLGSGGGGANLGKGAITIECSRLSPDRLNGTLAVIIHEIFHLIAYSSPFYVKNLEKSIPIIKISKTHIFYKLGYSSKNIINEAIINTLAPMGFISAKYVYKFSKNENIKVLDERMASIKDNMKQFERPDMLWVYFAAKELFPVIEKYFKNKKRINKDYFDKVIDLFKQFNLQYSVDSK